MRESKTQVKPNTTDQFAIYCGADATIENPSFDHIADL